MSKIPGAMWYYYLWLDDVVVCEGYVNTIAEYINKHEEEHYPTSSTITTYARTKSVLYGKYLVTREIKKCVPEKEVAIESIESVEKKSPFEIRYDSVKKHLKEFGNTCLNKKHNLDSFVNELLKDGIKVKSRWVEDETDVGFYILEVIDGAR